ncbi:stalled ribosome rescue protein Dom34 [Rhizobium sp. SLBN-94]|nr:stalled ribosome rescue protein Dom34 [Rhizobium sp. SLBN-94]
MSVDLTGLSEECVGMFGALHALTVSLVNQGVLDREKFIDQMLDLLAQMPEQQRQSFYGRYVALAVQMFEATQFPEQPIP